MTRKIIDINEDWLFCKTEEIPKQMPEGWQEVCLPHTWNAEDGQDGGNDYFRGTGVYCRCISGLTHQGCVFLDIPAAAMTADVWFNGEKVAHHEGGFSAFRCEITDLLREENFLCIAVDNSANNSVYPQKADFTFYGGLYRGVRLILTPDTHFEVVKDGTPGIKVTPLVENGNAHVKVESWQNGDGAVQFILDGMETDVCSVDGHAEAEFSIENAHLWNGVNDPFLYEVCARYGEDEISCRFGCRSMEFDPQDGFLLNGKRYPLRGVSRHQDCKGMGNAITLKEHREDMELIKEIGANAIRLAHYQQAQEFYDLCDENGMIVFTEIPYITMHMPSGRENALSQMRELITQNYNHTCIATWGLSNEITAASKVDEDLIENHRLLNDFCHRMDGTRPTSAAHAFMLETDSELLGIADVNSYNLYYGWYLGELQENDDFFDAWHETYPDKVIGFTEYGADANPQYQNSHPERGDYSETYQTVYHEHILKMIEERPYIACTFVWNMFDFAADGRDEGGKNGQNQKGLVTFDRSIKKDAFYLYKAWWSDKPFVHICGSRYIDRNEKETMVKVYSNQNEVALYVDGELFKAEEGNRIFRFNVPLEHEHTITARAGECSDEIRIRKVEKDNPDYQFLKAEEVVNWFDANTFDPNCFSIKDKLGDLMQNSATAAIVNRIMEAAKASRGDVAEASSQNANLQKMLAKMPLESLLKQAGPAIKADMIESLNNALQKIRK